MLTFVGFLQAGIIHESFVQFIHWADQENITSALRFASDNNEKSELADHTQQVCEFLKSRS